MINQINGQSNNPQLASGIIYAQVPDGVKYISDWPGFQLLPGHVIYDKTVTGCGFTEYCLRNDEDVILVSPRKILLENKEEQHSRNPNVYYFSIPSPDGESFDKTEKDLLDDVKVINRIGCGMIGISSKKVIEAQKKKAEALKKIVDLKDKLREWYNKSVLPVDRKPVKILVTYDSFHHVKEVLGNVIGNFRVVVDEFQSIFTDAQFKADVGLNIVDELSSIPNVIFLSATPVMSKYLAAIPQLANIPYVKLIWPVGYLSTPNITRYYEQKDLELAAGKVISSFKSGIFPKKQINDYIYESREAVFFVNNVRFLTSVIKKANLSPEEVNIICADTAKNRKAINKCNTRGNGLSMHQIGKIPLKGEPHKMFTFCTKTAYLGADFYSTCASTYIMSDVNLETMAVDIILDLPQIIGRQRLASNPFKNEIHIFYKTISGEGVLKKDFFDKFIEKKRSETTDALGLFGKASDSEALKLVGYVRNDRPYRKDYAGILRDSGNGKESIVFNPFMEAADFRAWEIVQVDYQNNLSVTNTINSTVFSPAINSSATPIQSLQGKLSLIFSGSTSPGFSDLLKNYCDLRDNYTNPIDVSEINSQFSRYSKVSASYETYYQIFGTETCKALRYRQKDLDLRSKDLIILQDIDMIANELLKILSIGNSYSLAEIKSTICKVFSDIGISTIIPKAADIIQFLDCALVNKNVSGFRKKSYKIKGKRQ